MKIDTHLRYWQTGCLTPLLTCCAHLPADGGFSIMDEVTYNGKTEIPIDTRYGGTRLYARLSS